jgi:uncharacterized protein
MQCPNCSTHIQLMERYDVDVDYCPFCKGVWLDRREIDKITKIQSTYDEEHYNKYHYRKGEYDDYDNDDGYYDNRRRKKSFKNRIEVLIDGIFAITMTLLVLDITIPHRHRVNILWIASYLR